MHIFLLNFWPRSRHCSYVGTGNADDCWPSERMTMVPQFGGLACGWIVSRRYCSSDECRECWCYYRLPECVCGSVANSYSLTNFVLCDMCNYCIFFNCIVSLDFGYKIDKWHGHWQVGIDNFDERYAWLCFWHGNTHTHYPPSCPRSPWLAVDLHNWPSCIINI